MDNSSNVDLENLKLKKEIEKLEAEINSLRPAQIRAWVTSLSIIVGIIVSVTGLIFTLSEIMQKNDKLRMESTIRSHELLINDVLDKISGVKVYHLKKIKGKFEVTGREMYGATVQRAAYSASVSLANDFDDLKPIVTEALKEQLDTADDEKVLPYLIKLKETQIVEEYLQKVEETRRKAIKLLEDLEERYAQDEQKQKEYKLLLERVNRSQSLHYLKKLIGD